MLPPPVKVDSNVLRTYKAILEVARTTRSGDPTANRFPWQAEVALSQLSELAMSEQQFLRARGDDSRLVIRVRTDSLPTRIYGGPVADKLSEFLQLGGEVRILLAPGCDGADVTNIRRFAGRQNVQIRKEKPGVLNIPRNHFFVVDNLGYRYEAEHHPFSGDEFRNGDDFHPAIPARICFNDTEGAGVLSQIFDQSWAVADDILPKLREV